MEAAWKNFDQLRKRESAYAWCIRIAKNKINRLQQSSKNQLKNPSEELLDIANTRDVEAMQYDILSEIIQKENLRQLRLPYQKSKILTRPF